MSLVWISVLPFSTVKRRPGLSWGVVAVLGLVLTGCQPKNAGEGAAKQMPPAMPVSVAEVITKVVPVEREFSGRLQAIDTVEVRPRVSGYIVGVHFRPGALVKKGTLLFSIDPRPYQEEVARAEAVVAMSQARLELAQTEFKRGQQLLNERAIAQRDVDERNANLKQLQATVRADSAALQNARLNLAWTQVYAPINGRISKAEITLGNLANSNTPLTTLVSVQPIYVGFNGDEASYLMFGQRARHEPEAVQVQVGLENENGFPHQGQLEFIDNRVDSSAGSIRMRAVLPNPDGVLTPGLFARVQLAMKDGKQAPVQVIAERAIGTDQNRKFVLVVNGENQAEYRPIQLGAPVGFGLRAVVAGLKPGERIIVDGLQRVRPGGTVVPQLVAMDSPPPAADGKAAPSKAEAASAASAVGAASAASS